jgi:hypothetical protein
MQEPIVIFSFFFVMFIFTIYQNYMVWFKYPIFREKLVRAYTRYADKLNLPFPSRTISYINSTAYKWITRFTLLLGLIFFSLPIILLVIFLWQYL